MPYDLTNGQEWAECPCCGKLAKGFDEIERFFGFRNMGDGRVIPQSYCRKCREAGCEAGSPCKAK